MGDCVSKTTATEHPTINKKEVSKSELPPDPVLHGDVKLRMCKAGHKIEKLNQPFQRKAQNAAESGDGHNVICAICNVNLNTIDGADYFRCSVRTCDEDFCANCVSCKECSHVLGLCNRNIYAIDGADPECKKCDRVVVNDEIQTHGFWHCPNKNH